MDIKLVFVPVLFLLLRVWNFVLDCLIVYTSEDTAKDFKESTAAAVLILMAVRQCDTHTACMELSEQPMKQTALAWPYSLLSIYSPALKAGQ